MSETTQSKNADPVSAAIRLVVFDLDGTLAPSKSPVAASTAALLLQLMDRVEVCVISGGDFPQFQQQLLPPLGSSPTLSRLHLMPTCGAQYFRWDSAGWREVYAEKLDADVKDRVIAVLKAGAAELGLVEPHPWGEIIQDRSTQITYSALGQQAPLTAKEAWDPDGSRRNRLRSYAAARLPDLEVRVGGSTSVDVTRVGIDKAYGIRQLEHLLGVRLDEMLFLGDRLDHDGNDYPVKALGVESIEVKDWRDTEKRISDMLAPSFRTARGLPLPLHHASVNLGRETSSDYFG